jgi:hypothetical protein
MKSREELGFESAALIDKYQVNIDAFSFLKFKMK